MACAVGAYGCGRILHFDDANFIQFHEAYLVVNACLYVDCLVPEFCLKKALHLEK
jgi:hypothetical protein